MKLYAATAAAGLQEKLNIFYLLNTSQENLQMEETA
jgi:hypothetical protein